MNSTADPRGSIWRRWDPHIHAPGTALNNQFGADDWDEYLTLIENSEPRIEALGVTDYYSIADYEKVVAYKVAGRLADVGLVFANVEMRLPTATATNPVNIHLLISPEDPDHVEEAKRFLNTLTFQYGSETYACNPADLIRLGKKSDPKIVDNGAALSVGSNLFKVTMENLKKSFSESAWAQQHIIVAVAGSSTDGTSGVRDDGASLAAVRTEIERVARVIFASSPKQRSFWIGDGVESVDKLNEKYDGVKVCLHGSDAHGLAAVGKPAENRYSWIKGDATFESLRQACLEPRERAIVADTPPSGALPHRVIQEISVSGAPWFSNGSVPLSSGLVAIIGARGSGKTALADLIAAGAGAASDDATDKTFLQRAKRHVQGAAVELTWADRRTTYAALPPVVDPDETPAVQYLSQQFVERLCSSEGITDELLDEIERVIFEAHPYEDRLGASTFRELLDIRANHGRGLRAYAKQEIDDLSDEIDTERATLDQLPALRVEQAQLTKLLTEDKGARSKLVIVGGEARSQRLDEINAELASRQAAIDGLRRREQALGELRSTTLDLRDRRLPGVTANLERTHEAAGLSAEEWKVFAITFAGDPVATIDVRLAAAKTAIAAHTGEMPARPDVPPVEMPAFVADDADLSKESLNVLRTEAWRLGQLIGLDSAKQKQLEALNTRISRNESLLTAADKKITNAEGASDRMKALQLKRKQAYASLFDGFASEQDQLTEMYSPLKEMLETELGTLGKLSFSVRRLVDVEAWAAQGESLLDLRMGEFRGRGELLRVATETLLPAWENGASNEVAEAMNTFRADHDQHLMAQARVPRTDAKAYWAWGKEVSAWLNSTEHITVSYGVQYDGVDIEQLSPGTRGIVLLLLYLAIDQSDDRPLIIDQPEENLDPKSIFDELVGRFVETRRRRQIIIVTHNANLVVNTDADQVIIAGAGAHVPGGLPTLSYLSGGLENPKVRDEVCEILEGGKPAFEERAKRLRIRLAQR
ncbi:TrlF family AAA-like ATPase [Microbacterium sp. T32]|uniref:TrlF family AAA-like ATPase n=1 Tax=Microbacterium sp. T32 TaxID=1776083 RepID=UPI0007AC2C37|nr:AAA family ATPase [Microbacterium sp. T32]KZE42065.1 hypothetical protein AVW09_11105 [Microbacterium sp. T32]